MSITTRAKGEELLLPRGVIYYFVRNFSHRTKLSEHKTLRGSNCTVHFIFIYCRGDLSRIRRLRKNYNEQVWIFTSVVLILFFTISRPKIPHSSFWPESKNSIFGHGMVKIEYHIRVFSEAKPRAAILPT